MDVNNQVLQLIKQYTPEQIIKTCQVSHVFRIGCEQIGWERIFKMKYPDDNIQYTNWKLMFNEMTFPSPEKITLQFS